MKRYGFIYDRMADWDLLKEAQKKACEGRKNSGVDAHKQHWIRNLCDIQQRIINHEMKTGKYLTKKIQNGKKLRDISTLTFHPNHIEHQALMLAGQKEIEKRLYRHSYGGRIGYGQHQGAMQLNTWVQRYSRDGGKYPIYLQLDIKKFYEHMIHEFIRSGLLSIFKDKQFVNAKMEPVEAFTDTGVGTPLGIPLSQRYAYILLYRLDMFIKHTLKCKCYIRLQDDMVLLCRNKGEAHRFAREIQAFLADMGLEIHQPRIDHVSNGIDFLGYVTYPYKGMFWRKRNKVNWLKHRSKVTNKKRLKELDASAWGYLCHGNKHCIKLYTKMNGVNFSSLGYKRPAQVDKNGKRIIDAQTITMSMIINQEVEIIDVESGIETKHGNDRVLLMIRIYDKTSKVFLNSPIKSMFVDLWAKGVTKMRTRFIDNGGKHYDIDENSTCILEVNGRKVVSVDGVAVFEDNNEQVSL